MGGNKLGRKIPCQSLERPILHMEHAHRTVTYLERANGFNDQYGSPSKFVEGLVGGNKLGRKNSCQSLERPMPHMQHAHRSVT